MCEQKFNADMRPFGEVKKHKWKLFCNMCLLHLNLIGVVDVKLAQEEQCTKMGLRSSSPLRFAAIQTIDIFTRGCYL